MGTVDGGEKREYFRVTDVFPLIVRKTSKDVSAVRSQAFPALTHQEFDKELLDDALNPKLWEILLQIDTKLTLILEKLFIEDDGLIEEKNATVGISEASLDFIAGEEFECRDIVEIKMLLPAVFPTRILLYGEVIRIDNQPNGMNRVVIRFIAVDPTVRAVVRKYILKRQRELIARESGLND